MRKYLWVGKRSVAQPGIFLSSLIFPNLFNFRARGNYLLWLHYLCIMSDVISQKLTLSFQKLQNMPKNQEFFICFLKLNKLNQIFPRVVVSAENFDYQYSLVRNEKDFLKFSAKIFTTFFSVLRQN